MKEYEIEITSITTVCIEAETEEEALAKAYEKALWEVADSNDASIISVIDLE